MPKDNSKEKQRHDPLHVELSQGSGSLRPNPRAKEGRKKSVQKGQDGFVNASQSKKILNLAKEQQDEIEQEERLERGESGNPERFKLENLSEDEQEAAWYDEDESDEDLDEEEYDELEDIEIDEADEDLFNRYVGEESNEPFSGTGNMTLADKIMQKVREKEENRPVQVQEGGEDDDEQPEGVMLPPKVIEAYSRIGYLLSQYRSGKLPKLFKMIPSMKKWEDVLYVTNPGAWSTQAVYQATRLFVSSLPPKKVEKFVRLVLYDRFRDDVQNPNTKRVANYHLVKALEKSFHRPRAFFKGFLFPLVESGTCSQQEAAVVGHVLGKISIPSEHSAAALMFLCEQPYSRATSYFVKCLVSKKYALPYKVIDALVYHFMQFRVETYKHGLPVIWHQSFLAFAQIYKNDITPEQRDALLDTVKVHLHHQIGPEIRRELAAGKPRGELLDVEMDF